ncbi:MULTISPECIES: heavy-metal-associated domain-containing protein [Brucella]|jgi:copper chaperone|uniref:Heavy metal-binding protein n=1 Tax=Brucella anthropi TaxID=529 RepID=A0A656Z708_BRUAN|nr:MULTISPECIES: heavy-metal-associated domain-containing protein [Brucella]KYB45006.1 heavy metal-binding protein [Brucella anthropi]MBK0020897.1 heavy-metal-associated domain-containing protein [Ochrobactrum sp. S45]MBK0042365.1 heavy-metal-associated domain-containing protein [Ochrobactrum sp. S46]MBO1023948.1 heavy-metal-associated domain-containing protein [Ochrobactrum sp. SD129]QWK78504.1 heavy-metal-associated domain-containing protein [Ochrobactrum sp. BTU1]
MVTFSIPKMKCGGCAESVTNALHKIDGASTVDIDLDKKEVKFVSNASNDDALNALAAAGYPATITQ